MLLADGRHHRFLSAAVGLAALAIGCAGAAVAASQVWTAPTELALPSGSSAVAANAIGCANPGDCAAGGTYTDSNGHGQPFVANETGGAWGLAGNLMMPSGAFGSAAAGEDSVTGVSCTAVEDCVATGFYEEAGGAVEAFVAGETAGSWARAQPLLEPHNGQDSMANGLALSCPSAGFCTAGGFYSDTGGHEQPFIATETNGNWGVEVQEPALPSPNTIGAAAIDGLSCTAIGTCGAAGYYQTSYGQEPMVASEASAAWLPATELAPPALNAATSGQGASAEAISCASAGNCAAGGQYTDTSSQTQAFVANEEDGVWGPASEVALPGNARDTGQSAAVTGISCPSAGICVAVGHYVDMAGEEQAFTADQTGGAWAQASELAEPGNAEPSGSQTAAATSVWCSGSGVCAAAGRYKDGGGNSQAMVTNAAPTLSASTSSLPAATIGVAYSAQLAASGGLGSYDWTVSAGVLPGGLSLNSAGGVISGTPTAIGSTTFLVSVADPGPPSQQASAMLTIDVMPPPATATVIGVQTVKSRKHSASFSFSANGEETGFECALVRERPAPRHHRHRRKHRKQLPRWPDPSYTACTSPKTYRDLGKGSYEFYVRAALPDATYAPAASAKFKIT